MHSARQVFPDRLRGLALLGIVVVNVPFLAISSDGFTAASIATPADATAAFLVIALAQGKFYLLFSFLFGYSAAFILRDGSEPNRRRFRRRLVALGTIGFLHAVFFFIGDILLTYAVLGFGLLAVSRNSDRAVRGWAVASALLGAAFIAIVVLPLLLLDPDDTSSSGLESLDLTLTDGSFLQAAWARLQALPLVLLLLLFLQGFMVFSAFCVGLLTARRQALADPAARGRLWRRLALFGVGIGLPLQMLAAAWQVRGIADPTDGWATATGTALGLLTAPVLSAGYVGVLGWLLVRRGQALRPLQWPGRTSLSVYIGESVVLSLVFSGYGLGQFGTWGAAAVVLAGIGTWLALTVLAWLWLRRFPQGPLERLVGTWTVGAARQA